MKADEFTDVSGSPVLLPTVKPENVGATALDAAFVSLMMQLPSVEGAVMDHATCAPVIV